MRPNKYDVTTAYRLCRDFVPPDGGDDCGSNTRIHVSSIGLLIKVCSDSSKKWHCLCRRQRTKWSSTNFHHRGTPTAEEKFYFRSSHSLPRNRYVLMLRQKLENQRHESQRQHCEPIPLPLLRNSNHSRILPLPVSHQSDKISRFYRQR